MKFHCRLSRILPLILITPLLMLIQCRPTSPNSQKISHSAYAWNQTWNQSDNLIIQSAAASLHSLYVLSAVIATPESNSRQSEVFDVPWREIASADVAVIPVIRMDSSCTERIHPDSAPLFASQAAKLASKIINAAAVARIQAHEIQLDFDCPTSKLAEYASFLSLVKKNIPEDFLLSITALPDWRRSPAFASLLRSCDSFTLQLHSLEKPVSYEDVYNLYDTNKFPEYIHTVSLYNKPFYLALPSYGYRLAFDEKGAFLSILTRRDGADFRKSSKIKTVMADPDDIFETLRWIETAKIPHLRGVIWFRLPGDDDSLAWPWPTLKRLIEGDRPAPDYILELADADAHVYDIRIRNNGTLESLSQIRCVIRMNSGCIDAYDIVDRFVESCELEKNTICFTGTAPQIGRPLHAGWVRIKPESDAHACFTTMNVEVLP